MEAKMAKKGFFLVEKILDLEENHNNDPYKTNLLVKWEGYVEPTWETLNVLLSPGATAEDMVISFVHENFPDLEVYMDKANGRRRFSIANREEVDAQVARGEWDLVEDVDEEVNAVEQPKKKETTKTNPPVLRSSRGKVAIAEVEEEVIEKAKKTRKRRSTVQFDKSPSVEVPEEEGYLEHVAQLSGTSTGSFAVRRSSRGKVAIAEVDDKVIEKAKRTIRTRRLTDKFQKSPSVEVPEDKRYLEHVAQLSGTSTGNSAVRTSSRGKVAIAEVDDEVIEKAKRTIRTRRFTDKFQKSPSVEVPEDKRYLEHVAQLSGTSTGNSAVRRSSRGKVAIAEVDDEVIEAAKKKKTRRSTVPVQKSPTVNMPDEEGDLEPVAQSSGSENGSGNGGENVVKDKDELTFHKYMKYSGWDAFVVSENWSPKFEKVIVMPNFNLQNKDIVAKMKAVLFKQYGNGKVLKLDRDSNGVIFGKVVTIV